MSSVHLAARPFPSPFIQSVAFVFNFPLRSATEEGERAEGQKSTRSISRSSFAEYTTQFCISLFRSRISNANVTSECLDVPTKRRHGVIPEGKGSKGRGNGDCLRLRRRRAYSIKFRHHLDFNARSRNNNVHGLVTCISLIDFSALRALAMT